MAVAAFDERYSRLSHWLRPGDESARRDLMGNIFACLIPMLTFIEFDLVGRLFASEILLAILLPFLLVMRGQNLFSSLPKTLLWLGLLWLLSLITTDVIRETPFEDWTRGWSKIGFLLLNFMSIYLYLNGKQSRFFWFAMGIALSQILAYFINPNVYAEGHPWKFGYGIAVTQITILIANTRFFSGRSLMPSAMIFAVGALNFYMDFRSMGLICLLAGAFVLGQQSDQLKIRKMTLGKFTIVAALLGFTLYGVSALYEYGAGAGWLGEDAYEKYELQSGGQGGVLLGGRSEILAAGEAILESPVIGHGSWAKDPKYLEILMEALRQRGYAIQGEMQSELIPSHSHILGAWVEAGILGAIFWFWAFILTVRSLILIRNSSLVLISLISFTALSMLWSIPFSPFGGEGRLYMAYSLSLMMFALNWKTPGSAQRAVE